MIRSPEDTPGVDIQLDQAQKVIDYKTELAEYTVNSWGSTIRERNGKVTYAIAAKPTREQLNRPLEHDMKLKEFESLFKQRTAFLKETKMHTIAGEILCEKVDDLQDKVEDWAIAHRRIAHEISEENWDFFYLRESQ